MPATQARVRRKSKSSTRGGVGGGGVGEEVTDIWSKKPIDIAGKDVLKLVKLPSLKMIC